MEKTFFCTHCQDVTVGKDGQGCKVCASCDRPLSMFMEGDAMLKEEDFARIWGEGKITFSIGNMSVDERITHALERIADSLEKQQK